MKQLEAYIAENELSELKRSLCTDNNGDCILITATSQDDI